MFQLTNNRFENHQSSLQFHLNFVLFKNNMVQALWWLLLLICHSFVIHRGIEQTLIIDRSSHQRCSIKKTLFIKVLQYLQENACVWKCLFIGKILQKRSFPVNNASFWEQCFWRASANDFFCINNDPFISEIVDWFV